MNGIEKIIDHIKAESAVECEAVAAEASAACAALRLESEQAANAEYDRLLAQGTKEVALRLERLTSMAALEAKKQILITQHEMIAQAFELAVTKLAALPEQDYISLMVKLAVQASLSGEEELVFSAGDRSRVGAAICDGANAALRSAGKNAALALSGETADIRGGFIMSGGNIQVNCGLDALVAQYKNELSPSVAAQLFD